MKQCYCLCVVLREKIICFIFPIGKELSFPFSLFPSLLIDSYKIVVAPQSHYTTGSAPLRNHTPGLCVPMDNVLILVKSPFHMLLPNVMILYFCFLWPSNWNKWEVKRQKSVTPNWREMQWKSKIISWFEPFLTHLHCKRAHDTFDTRCLQLHIGQDAAKVTGHEVYMNKNPLT